VRIALIAAIVLAFGMALLEKTGEYLVMDQPAHRDVIVILAGDRNDRRFFRGLVHQEYAPRMLVDANSDMNFFGRTPAVLEEAIDQKPWSVAACRDDSGFKQNWWQRREWTKTAFMEWIKLVWWEAVDRWHH